jgi:hypothetical protein
MQFTAGKIKSPPYIEHIDHNKMISPYKCAHSDNSMSQQVKIFSIYGVFDQMLCKVFRCRTMPENRQIFSNSSYGINLVPVTGSATVTPSSETSRTARQ